MKILGTLVSEDWEKQRKFAEPFGILLGQMGATASEPWFTAYFKSGRDNTVENQQADIVLLETEIVGTHHNLILELSKEEAQQLRAKCDRLNRLREAMDEETQLGDFATGELTDYINKNA